MSYRNNYYQNQQYNQEYDQEYNQYNYGNQYYQNDANMYGQYPTYTSSSGPKRPAHAYQDSRFDTEKYAVYSVSGSEKARKPRYPPNMQPYPSLHSQASLDSKSSTKNLKPANYIDDDDDDEYYGERFCCGCFKSKQKCKQVVGSICVIFVILLAVTLFFLWPRSPQVSLDNPLANIGKSDSSIGQLSFSGVPDINQATPDNPFIASISLMITVSVYSPNYIQYAFSGLDISVKLMDSDGKGTQVSKNPVGRGSIGRQAFPPMSTTNFTLPFNVTFVSTQPFSSSEDNPEITTLIRSCGAKLLPGVQPSKKPNFLPIKVAGLVHSKLIDWTGFTANFYRDMYIPCPTSTGDLIKRLTNKK